MFVLHGNVQDLVRTGGDASSSYGTLADFLAEQIFGRWDLILHYDLARGLRAFAGPDGDRLKDMVVLANRKVGDLASARKDPATAFALLDRFVQNNIMAAENERVSAAVLIDHASFLVPSGEPGRLSATASTQVVTLLNWAASPHVKRLNMAFVLMDEKLSALSERLAGSPHVASRSRSLCPTRRSASSSFESAAGDRDLQTGFRLRPRRTGARSRRAFLWST